MTTKNIKQTQVKEITDPSIVHYYQLYKMLHAEDFIMNSPSPEFIISFLTIAFAASTAQNITHIKHIIGMTSVVKKGLVIGMLFKPLLASGISQAMQPSALVEYQFERELVKNRVLDLRKTG